MSKRVHKALRLEELEPRVAPVTLTGSSPVYRFTDTDGDELDIALRGDGKAEITWVNGGSTPAPRDEIASIELIGTSERNSVFYIADANPQRGGDTMSA